MVVSSGGEEAFLGECEVCARCVALISASNLEDIGSRSEVVQRKMEPKQSTGLFQELASVGCCSCRTTITI